MSEKHDHVTSPHEFAAILVRIYGADPPDGMCADPRLVAMREATMQYERLHAANADRLPVINEWKSLCADAESLRLSLARETEARKAAERELEKSRRTVYFTWRDVEACREALSISADIKGDTLEEVVRFLLNERVSRTTPPAVRPMTRDEADAVEEIESAMFLAPPADAATEADIRKHRSTLLQGLAYIARESWWPDDASVTDGVRAHVGWMRDAVDALSAPPAATSTHAKDEKP